MADDQATTSASGRRQPQRASSPGWKHAQRRVVQGRAVRRVDRGTVLVRPPHPIEPWASVLDASSYADAPATVDVGRAAGRRRAPDRVRPTRRRPVRLGLPYRERLDSGGRRRRGTRHGLVPRRRSRRSAPATCRSTTGQPRSGRRHGRCHGQPSPRVARLPRPRRPGRTGAPAGRERRLARHDRRAPLGPREHRSLRWRPWERHHLRPVGRRPEGDAVAGRSVRCRPVPQGHHPEWSRPACRRRLLGYDDLIGDPGRPVLRRSTSWSSFPSTVFWPRRSTCSVARCRPGRIASARPWTAACSPYTPSIRLPLRPRPRCTHDRDDPRRDDPVPPPGADAG